MVLKSGSVYPGDFKQVILLYVILLIDILVQLFQNSNKLAKNELASIHVITIGHVLQRNRSHFGRILWQFTQFFFYIFDTFYWNIHIRNDDFLYKIYNNSFSSSIELVLGFCRTQLQLHYFNFN